MRCCRGRGAVRRWLGEQRAQPVFEPAQQLDVVLVGRQTTTVSMAVWRLQRLGPRRARRRWTSMGALRERGRAHARRQLSRCRRRSARGQCPAPRRRHRGQHGIASQDWPALRPKALQQGIDVGAQLFAWSASSRALPSRSTTARPPPWRGVPPWRGRLRCCGCRRSPRRRTVRAMSATCASSAALSTAAPSASTTSTWVRSTLKICSRSRARRGRQAVVERQVGDDADRAAVVGQAVAEDGAGIVLGHHGVHACRFISRRSAAS
jgi:hypothetical protein